MYRILSKGCLFGLNSRIIKKKKIQMVRQCANFGNHALSKIGLKMLLIKGVDMLLGIEFKISLIVFPSPLVLSPFFKAFATGISIKLCFYIKVFFILFGIILLFSIGLFFC